MWHTAELATPNGDEGLKKSLDLIYEVGQLEQNNNESTIADSVFLISWLQFDGLQNAWAGLGNISGISGLLSKRCTTLLTTIT